MKVALMIMLVIHYFLLAFVSFVTLNHRFFICNIEVIKTLNLTGELIILSCTIFVTHRCDSICTTVIIIIKSINRCLCLMQISSI